MHSTVPQAWVLEFVPDFHTVGSWWIIEGGPGTGITDPAGIRFHRLIRGIHNERFRKPDILRGLVSHTRIQG